MTTWLRRHYEKWLVAGLALLLVGSGIWAWRQELRIQAVPRRAALRALPAVTMVMSPWPKPLAVGAAWPKPAPQSNGSGWIYEVFTPPVIYYNLTARSFSVTPPQYAGVGMNETFGLRLRSVRREPFRLQLAGYFGEAENYLIAFVNPGSAQPSFARVGHRFADLGLTLKSFAVTKVPLARGAGQPVYDVAGVATMWDEYAGEDVVLNTVAPLVTENALARFDLSGVRGRTLELREGDSLEDDGAIYRIERIQVAPAEVVVSRKLPGMPASETRVLHPDPTEGGVTQLTRADDRPEHRPASLAGLP